MTAELVYEVSFCRGDRARNPRKGEVRMIKSTVHEGYGLLRQRILRLLEDPPFSSDGSRLIEEAVYSTNHLVLTHGRQPDSTPVQLSDDNTARQARALDTTAETASEDDSDVSTIEVEIAGIWLRLPVRVSSPRAALRLPQHDMLTRDSFHGFTPVIPPPTNGTSRTLTTRVKTER
ncbi:hypothetical protein P43SY_000067 [Pythium insidiosum]|uniref:Uncharacterized protein n=1 Tax=Pythium insidiosum TaxID=114742 RepID=A0AAD5LWT3_PYTIN|nr:hypothetical protein P43SY_000067 [Pythium insidiosum]